jgi:uncharacterized protein
LKALDKLNSYIVEGTPDLKKFTRLAKKMIPENEEFFENVLQKTRRRDLDGLVDQFHEEAFGHIDCLKCANCCKTISPTFEQDDIRRIAKFKQMKPGEFIKKYLHMDEEGDFVHNGAPCPFLNGNNYCSIYEVRPEACRGYPHTNERKFKSILDITLQNTEFCPAVFEIVEKLKNEF